MSVKVSVLVPVYNVSKFIERCAVSLFEQTFDDIEFIFVDDCSPDNSVAILTDVIKRYPKRQSKVRIISHQSNRGLAGARNTGVENAAGEFILHVDSDDYIEKNMVQLMYNKAIESDADVVLCDFFLEWANSSKVVSQNYSEDKFEFVNLILQNRSTPAVWNKMFKRILYTENNIKNPLGINLGEDLVTTPKLIYKAKKIVKVHKPLYHYMQINGVSYTKTVSNKNISDVVNVMRNLTDYFANEGIIAKLEHSFTIGKIKKKLEFILNSNDETLSTALLLFPEITEFKEKDSLTIKEAVVWYLISRNDLMFLKIFLNGYTGVFSLVQKIKGR